MFGSKRGKRAKSGAVRFQNTATPQGNEHVAPGYRDEDLLSSSNSKYRTKQRNANKEQGNLSPNSTNSKSGSKIGTENELFEPVTPTGTLDSQQVEPPPPGPGTMDETEAILLKLHSSLIDFYTKHKPENVDEDVLTILMQFFIDAGGIALNKKLMDKYGEDLNTFTPIGEDELPPPPAEYSTQTLERVKRRSLEAEYDIQLPPPPKFEAEKPNIPMPPQTTKKREKKKKKKVVNTELDAYKAEKNKAISDLEADLDKDLFGDVSTEDPKLKLDMLDKPSDAELTARDLIEAFYAKHDESKLEKDTGIEKFVMWVEQHSLEGLSDKLKGKYGEGLFDVQKLARRRRNLEDALTNFYLKHDRAKLETRWTIMKILNWTMINGLPALNKKFMTRYGLQVVPIP